MKNIKILVLPLLAAFFGGNFFASQEIIELEQDPEMYESRLGFELKEAEKYNYSYKSMVIILDDSEEFGVAEGRYDSLKPAGSMLITALKQKTGPIIASISLFKNIFVHMETRKFGKVLQFNTDEWVVKEIGDDLCILVTSSYLQEQGINLDDVNEIMDDPKVVSDVELRLGIKINHLPTVTFYDLILKLENQEKFNSAETFMNNLYDASLKKSNIFCVRSDYVDQNFDLPLWSFYMMGHGTIRKEIVGLTLNDFKKVLDFFANNIMTRLLVYSSCYAAGINIRLVYQEFSSDIQEAYPFTIITQVLTDAPASVFSVKLKGGKLVTYLDLKRFLLQTIESDAIDYFKLVKDLWLKSSFSYDYRNTPQIKLPGLEWFSVIDHQKIASIGLVLVNTRDSERPLDVNKFFGKRPEVLLIYSEDIPFELIINGKNLNAIISMISASNLYQRIRQVTSEANSTKEILDWFMKIEGLRVNKTFLIEQINNDVFNVIVKLTNFGEVYAWYTIGDGTVYKQTKIFKNEEEFIFKDEIEINQVADEGELQIYQEILNRLMEYPFEYDVSLLSSKVSKEDIRKIETILQKGHKGIIEETLKKQKKRAKDRDAISFLFKQKDEEGIEKFVLDENINVNLKINGKSMLQIAIANDMHDLMRFFVDKDAKMDLIGKTKNLITRKLESAIDNKNIDLIELYLDVFQTQQSEKDYQNDLEFTSYGVFEGNSLDIVKLLIQRGAKVNEDDVEYAQNPEIKAYLESLLEK